MKKDLFLKGMAMLKEVFNKAFNLVIYWEALKDIDDASFRDAVLEIIKTQKELYPNTNMIAIIRDRAQTIRRNNLSRGPAQPQIQDQRQPDCAPPPEEWESLKKKLKGFGSIEP